MEESESVFWGVKEKLSDASTVRCKGNWLSARLRYVRERAGDSGVERVSQRLAPEQRALFLKPPLSFT
ncbi:MAG: hypothetical protein ACI9KE_004409 [Polyangiales bacterium]|jgi:hypothetical protein